MRGVEGVSASRLARAREDLAVDPSDCCRLSNLANALWLDDRLPEAMSWVRWAVRSRGTSTWHPLVDRCYGNILLDCGQYAEADNAYRRSDPESLSAATQFNRAKAALGMGDFDLAWRLFERRLNLKPAPDGVVDGPWWQGWLEADQVTVWCEQGLGDTLQFVRWLPALAARVSRVRCCVQPSLHRLLDRGLAWMGEKVVVVTDPLSKSEGCHGSLLSLPWLLKESAPPWPRAQGYVSVQAAHRMPSGQKKAPFQVGVMWGAGRYLDGGARERDYYRKSVLGTDLSSLLHELRRRPVQLVNLQVGPDRDCPAQAGIEWDCFLDPRADFFDLALLMGSLDLIITVDTACAHLAGAMGLPTWVLLPWAAASRWGRDTDSSPWYPTLRLWRQPRHQDWIGLWPTLLTALDQYVCDEDFGIAVRTDPQLM